MTQRRRFFPSTPVQTAPGNTVEVEVQMRKGSAPVVAASAPTSMEPVLSWVSPDEAFAVDILRDPSSAQRFEVVQSDDGLIHVRQKNPEWEPREMTTGWRGTPWRVTVDDDPLPMAGPGWQCELIECAVSIPDQYDRPPPVCYTGCIVGVATERVTWRLEWAESYGDGDTSYGNIARDYAVSSSGHVARASGCMLMVCPVWYGGSGDARETLTATPLVDGQIVGSLKFVAIHRGW